MLVLQFIACMHSNNALRLDDVNSVITDKLRPHSFRNAERHCYSSIPSVRFSVRLCQTPVRVKTAKQIVELLPLSCSTVFRVEFGRN